MNMLRIEVSETDLKNLDEKLDGLKNPKSALKTALNNTAKEVQKGLSETAAGLYRYKGGKSAINKTGSIRKATATRSEATITFVSPVNEIKQFYVSNLAVSGTKLTAGGRRSRRTIKGAVLKNAAPKALTGATGRAFIVRFKSGHISVVSRDPSKTADKYRGKYKLNKHTQKLRVWRSPSVPTMIGNKKVYTNAEPKILKEMHEQVEKVIEKAIYG